jgi:tripartite-type tricarboxylate transporter receptor subunit TctC
MISQSSITDLLAGQVQVMFDNIPSSIQHIAAGKLRPLAVTTAEPSEQLPGLPVVADFLPGYEASAWYGIGAPKGTPTEIISRLNKEINAILAEPRAKTRFAELGGSLLTGSPTDFGKFVADETENWAKVVKFANIKPE